MDEARVRSLVKELARAVDPSTEEPSATSKEGAGAGERAAGGAADRLLARIVLADILDDSILSAKPGERTFPLRLFFAELGALLVKDGDDADHAFAFASGLNFFFRAEMDGEGKVRVALEVSRALYALARVARLGPDMLSNAAPLLAALMSSELDRVKLESVDHARVFDSRLHERTPASDPTASRILQPASFLCLVSTNNAVKAKAQVVT